MRDPQSRVVYEMNPNSISPSALTGNSLYIRGGTYKRTSLGSDLIKIQLVLLIPNVLHLLQQRDYTPLSWIIALWMRAMPFVAPKSHQIMDQAWNTTLWDTRAIATSSDFFFIEDCGEGMIELNYLTTSQCKLSKNEKNNEKMQALQCNSLL